MERIKKTFFRIVPETWRNTISIARAREPLLPILAQHAKGGIFVDVGANIGVYTHSLRSVATQVIAFEPVASLASALRRRYPDIEVHACALSASNGPAILHIPRRAREAVLTRASLNADANHGFTLEAVPIERRTLDSFTLSNVSAIKIDVEGHEEEVLRGAVQTIKECRPALLVEIEERHHPGKSADLMQWIEDIGYRAYFHDGYGLASADARDFAVWQPPAAAKDAFGKAQAAYINNFLFLPLL